VVAVRSGEVRLKISIAVNVIQDLDEPFDRGFYALA
jgi:hypothetical protein